MHMLRLFVVVLTLLALSGSTALAYSCTYYTTYQDGKIRYCKQCCASSGHTCWVDCS